MNHNDRGTICQNRFIASTKIFFILKINFRSLHGKYLSVNLLRALPRLTRVSAEHLPVNNVTQPFTLLAKIFSLKTDFCDQHSAFALHRIRVRFSSRKSSTIFAHALWAVLIRLGGLMEAVVRRGRL
jgi:hypothetical protein